MAAVFRLRAALAALFLIVPLAHADVTVSAIAPTPGNGVSSLTSISITFSEAVTNVSTESLLINGETPQNVTGSGVGPYIFTFPEPPAGLVSVGFGVDLSIAPVSGSGQFTPPDSWTYVLSDTVAPTAAVVAPAAGSTTGALTQARVTFSEPVTGVSANDLTVNGVAATSVDGSGAGPYVFTFASPATGTVNFAWAPGHGIADLAGNAFAASGWSVTRSASGAGNLIINEFASVNSSTTYLDENGDNEAWIEIYNPGPASVNLTGWALTDDPEVPGKWIFPNRSIASGGYLVVFASEKNRTPTSGNLHTNFKLGVNSGYLALVKPDQPTAKASEFVDFPGQRAGYSYGLLSSQVKYLSPPTPGATNTTSTGLSAVAAAPSLSAGRGFYTNTFNLALSTTTPGATIRYTTDGSEPTSGTGTLYTTPVTISDTTVLRAATFANGYVPSASVTASYIFLDKVLDQPDNPAGLPTTWGTNSNFPGNIIPADYGMDRDPLRVTPTDSNSAIDAAKLQRFNAGMHELATVSIAIPNSDMFASTGMYYSSNVQNKNFPAKAASIEMILPDGTTAFATTAGLGIKGNASRDPAKNPKHAFGLKFKSEFGPTKLDYPIFPEIPTSSYDNLVLRAEFGISWRHWDSSQRSMSSGIRDLWSKDAMRELGGVASHSRLVHLYINGLYFGVFDISEDPNAAFGESFLGGDSSDYDAIEQGSVKDGSSTAYNALLALPAATDNATYEDYKARVNMTEFIDYTILHFYIAHQDWGANKNWAALRQRSGGTFTTEGKFRYIPWDQENILLNVNSNRVSSTDVPSGLHTKLDDNDQYRLDFADRVHRALVAPGGALTTSRNIARWQKWQAVWDDPIVAESCRWGDYRRDVHPYSGGPYELYTREAQWTAENNRIVTSYFPSRATIIMDQLRAGGLYPTLNAPEFRVNGAAVGSGQFLPGTQLTMALPTAPSGTTSAGTIYYTTDGTDPRVIYSGTVSSSATVYSSTPVTLNGPVTIKARALNGGTWSALNEATIVTDSSPPPIRISEIMYNPSSSSVAEYIELFNAGTQPVDLNGWYFSGIDYVFPPGSIIPPGGRLVLASNDDPAGWRALYPGVTPFAYYAGSLSNGGETVALLDDAGTTVSTVAYQDKSPWPTSADGGGYSLELVDPSFAANDSSNWQASGSIGGSPGSQNSLPLPPVVSIDPQSQTVQQGNTATFTAAATGKALRYEWKLENDSVSGATTATCSIPGVTPAKEGAYRCIISNLGGSATTNPATLTVSQDYPQWAASAGLAGADADADADPDKDGLPNVVEFYHHLDPNIPTSGADLAALPTAGIETVGGEPMLGITYRTNRRAVVTAAVFERSTTLANSWAVEAPQSVENLTSDPATGDPRVRALFPLDAQQTASFVRMRLTP